MHIAIIGCGQLARMLALAGWSMGIRFSFLAADTDDTRCVDGLGLVVRNTPGSTAESLYHALGQPNVITVEKEAVDTALLQGFVDKCTVAPSPGILHIIQHRARQKAFLDDNAIPTAPYFHLRSKDQLWDAVKALGFPLIIKACEQGYDGQHQWRLSNENETHALINGPIEIGDAIVETKLSFTKEVSVILARNTLGEVAVYCPTENTHVNGTLFVSIAPARELSESHQEQLSQITNTLVKAWDYVGVLAIECFIVDDKVVVNELAPRVHNSGHWTQDGAATSQFENHLRAICGRTLGATTDLAVTGMINLLGCTAPEELLSHAHAHFHWYNKTLRNERKMGHINFVCNDQEALAADIKLAIDLLKR